MAIKDLLERFKKGLAKTAQLFNFRSWFGRKVDQSFLDDLEARLIQADVGVASTVESSIASARRFADKTADENLMEFVKNELKDLLADPRPGTLTVAPKKPTVYLIAGVNGSGKTTSIAKLAQRLKDEGQIDPPRRLRHLPRRRRRPARRSGPSAPAPTSSGRTRRRPGQRRPRRLRPRPRPRVDILIVDTAGRLHTQTHLMRELEKIRASFSGRSPASPHEVLLVLDATNGQNAIRQAEVFTKSIGCTGVILTKLDGTAKGGVVVAVRQTINLPVKFIGVGEAIDDLQPFDADTFVESLFA